MMDDLYEEFRDVLRQIAVHEPSSALVYAAEACLADQSPAALELVLTLSDGSRYRQRLLSAYGAMIVMEAA